MGNNCRVSFHKRIFVRVMRVSIGSTVHNKFRAFMFAYVEDSVSESRRAKSVTSLFDEEVPVCAI